ncbi:response regulator [Frigoribacterium sp. 2-23]|uniref:response regulator n=1 Tax=Frigoribacterium sp. 2-23 TaxID=3415006 RepID=UPI003C6EB96E
MIRVVVVDDHPLVRGGLRAVIDAADDLEVVGEAASGEEALVTVPDVGPRVVLMDVSMPGLGGIEATRRLTALGTDAAIVMLTTFPDAATVRAALGAGAIGYLLKDADPVVVLSGIRSAAAGHAPIDPRAAKTLLPGAAGAAGAADVAAARAAPAAATSADPPRGREADVLRLIARGLPNKLIASELGISERTVKAHVGSLFRRIGVSDRTSAALWARDHDMTRDG